MKRAGVIALLIVAAFPLLMAVAELPPQGSVENPPSTHVTPRYLARGEAEAGSPNVVTDIILNYRGFDTNGEVTVIFTALIAVVAVLSRERSGGRPADAEAGDSSERIATDVSPVVGFVVRVVAPFTALLGIFTILHGHVSPGGGFQGGTILGALLIILSIVVGRERTRGLLPDHTLRWLQAAGVLAFVLIGVAGAVLYGHYLGFPKEEPLHLVREIGLVALEFGIGVAGMVIAATLFWSVEEPR